MRIVQVGLASEADLALALTYARAVALGLASEVDEALAIVMVGGALLVIGKYAREHAEARAAIMAAAAAGYSREHAEARAAIIAAGVD